MSLIKTFIKETGFSFAIKHELRALKRDGKISDTLIYTFKMEAKKILSTSCNHIRKKSPLNSYFARCTRSRSPLYLAEALPRCSIYLQHVLYKFARGQIFDLVFIFILGELFSSVLSS